MQLMVPYGSGQVLWRGTPTEKQTFHPLIPFTFHSLTLNCPSAERSLPTSGEEEGECREQRRSTTSYCHPCKDTTLEFPLLGKRDIVPATLQP